MSASESAESRSECAYEKIIADFTAAHQFDLRNLGLGPMDIHQQLSALDKKLASLHQRANRHSTSEETEKVSPQEIVVSSLKTRTDDLSKISVNVLKFYAENDKNLDRAEKQFFEKYVKPIKHYL